ncbi:MAG: dihydrofolate reductase family protein [Cyanobacteria bacterium MAG CAR4_bin_6]|nr:dihydrofolate reductase family protein [Cyanobacteria bacterium MAG CAR4_bin_6]
MDARAGGGAMGPQFCLVLAVSLDGRLAPPQGGAAKLGGAADRRALEESLAWADACLVGAGTLRTHGSTCLIHGEDLLRQRRRQQRPDHPPLVVVSRHARLDGTLPVFQQPLECWWLAPGQTWVDQVPPWFRGALPLSHWRALPPTMARQGWQRLVVLGGAQLATTLAAHDLLHEIRLTLCPTLLGGGRLWLQDRALIPPNRWRPVESRSLGGGEWLCRWRRQPECNPSTDPPP